MEVTIHSQLMSVPKSTWERLYPSLPDSYEMMELFEKTGYEGYTLYSIVVRSGELPILHIPLYSSVYNVSESLDGVVKKLAQLAAPLLPGILRCNLASIGFVASDWGHIGFDRTQDPKELKKAWILAQGALEEFVSNSKASMIAYVVMDNEGGAILPPETLDGFTEIPGSPCCVLPIGWSNVDDYLSSLSKATRKDLRRKLKESEGIRIVHSKEPGPYLDTMMSYYLETISRAESVTGVHPIDYLRDVCSSVPDTEYIFYFLGEKLIGYNLLSKVRDMMVDKLFCMDPVLGREHNLYFVSWIENVRFCIEKGVRLYHAGAAKEDVKVRLGAKPISTVILFKHRNRFINFIFSKVQQALVQKPAVEVPPVMLGSFWRQGTTEAAA